MGILNIFEKHFETLNIIEVNRKNILHNYDLIKSLRSDCDIWPVLKSNAYGHGLKQMVEILKKRKFEYLVVDSYYEALIIRELTNRQILIIGSILPNNFSQMKWKNLAIMVQDKITVESLGKLNKKIKIHLKVNTGMNRQGIKLEEISEIVEVIKKYPNLEFEGLFSHLADADSSSNDYTMMQIELFDKMVKLIEERGIKLKYCHISASSGICKIKNPKINAIRLGIGLYGYNPLSLEDKYYEKFKELKPALIFKTVFTKVSQIKKGEKVSYNCTFTATKKTNIGVIPVGYYEALDRRMSNKGWVKYNNKFYPIIGRICMNMSVVDLGGDEAELFDKVEVISINTKDKNSVKNIAEVCQTIPYEILVKINNSIRRVVV